MMMKTDETETLVQTTGLHLHQLLLLHPEVLFKTNPTAKTTTVGVETVRTGLSIPQSPSRHLEFGIS